MDNNASFIPPPTFGLTQVQKRRSPVGPRKRNNLSGNIDAESDAPIEDVPTNIDSKDNAPVEDEELNITSALRCIKINREESEGRKMREGRRVRRDECIWCAAPISKGDKLNCKICGKDPRPADCSCGMPAVNRAKCEKCRDTSIREWLNLVEEGF